jgi:hypothetical protein
LDESFLDDLIRQLIGDTNGIVSPDDPFRRISFTQEAIIPDRSTNVRNMELEIFVPRDGKMEKKAFRGLFDRVQFRKKRGIVLGPENDSAYVLGPKRYG